MPPGSRLTLRGRFPHARYFKFALYRFVNNTFTAIGGEDLIGWDIEPDDGSSNPYVVGADRSVKNRNYTVHVVAADAPKQRADRAGNTLYAGREERVIQIVVRIYVSDRPFDGAGLARADRPSSVGSLLTYEATLADGRRLSTEELISIPAASVLCSAVDGNRSVVQVGALEEERPKPDSGCCTCAPRRTMGGLPRDEVHGRRRSFNRPSGGRRLSLRASRKLAQTPQLFT